MLHRTIIVDVIPTPDELAFEFSKMNDEQQAIFFNEVANIVDKWDKPFCFQLRAIIDNPALTIDGKMLMQEIGDYGNEPYKREQIPPISKREE